MFMETERIYIGCLIRLDSHQDSVNSSREKCDLLLKILIDPSSFCEGFFLQAVWLLHCSDQYWGFISIKSFNWNLRWCKFITCVSTHRRSVWTRTLHGTSSEDTYQSPRVYRIDLHCWYFVKCLLCYFANYNFFVVLKIENNTQV